MEYNNNTSQGWGTGTFPYPQMQQNNFNQQPYQYGYQNQPPQANYYQQQPYPQQQQPPLPPGYQGTYPNSQQQQQHPPYNNFTGGYQQPQQPQVPFAGGYQQPQPQLTGYPPQQQQQQPCQTQDYNSQQGGFNPQPQQPQAPSQGQTYNNQPQHHQANAWCQPPPQCQPVGSYPQPPQPTYHQQQQQQQQPSPYPQNYQGGYPNASLPPSGNQFSNNYQQHPHQQTTYNTYSDARQLTQPNSQFSGNSQQGMLYRSPPPQPSQQNSPPPNYHEDYTDASRPSSNNQFTDKSQRPPKVDPRGKPTQQYQQNEQNPIDFPGSEPFINKQDPSSFSSGTNPRQNFNGGGGNQNMFANQTSFAGDQKGYNNRNGSGYSNGYDPYVLGKELAEMYVKILFNGEQKSKDSLFGATFVFGEAILAALEEYKRERTNSLSYSDKSEFERRFKEVLGIDVNKIVIKKDKIVIFSNIPKKGDEKHSEIERGNKDIALSEITVNNKRIAYTTCSEKTSDKSFLEKYVVGWFKKTVEISPSDIVYVKVDGQDAIEKDYIDRKITPLWIRKVDDHGYSYYIVALNSKSIKKGITGMSDEDILKALTGINTISQVAVSIAAKAPHIDYGQGENMLSKSDIPRCKDFLWCSDTSSRHIKGHLHACKYGDRCTKMGDPNHCKSYIHVQTSCRYGTSCTDKGAEHRMLYHGEVKRWCMQNPCCEYGKPEHMEEFMHGPRPAKLISFDGFATEKGTFPDYDRNMELWMEQTGRYLGDRNIKTTNRCFQQITSWMGNFQPVHQCGKDALISIAKIGVISSLTRLKSMWLSPEDISHMVWLQRKGAEFLSRLTGEGDQEKYRVAKKFVFWYCRFIQATKSPEIAKSLTDKVILGIPIESLRFAIEAFNKVPKLTSKEGEKWEKVDRNASKILGKDKESLKGMVESVMGAVQETLENMRALNFGVDQEMGTDRMVFAIHGPNMGKYGGAEVAIVFRPEISRHPDFFMTPVAAIGYHDGWYVENPRVGTDRPWVGEGKSWKRGQTGNVSAGTANEDYERSKFHITTKGWTEACAMEWISRVVQKSRKSGNPKSPQCVTLEDIQQLWHDSDPHTAIEAHLPGLISLDLIDRVYIANNVKSGTGDTERILREFGVNVEYVDDTRDAVERYMSTPRQNHYQQPRINERGYEFYVEEGGKECVMPIDIERLCGKCIRFTVVNRESKTSDLMVTFSDMAPSRTNDSPRECSSFVIRPFNQDGYFIEGLPKNIAKKSTSLVHPVCGFTSSVLEDVIYYTINFNRDSVVLKKSGVSSVFNNNLMKIPRKNYRFLSFSSSLFPCYISNVFVADLSSNDSSADRNVQLMQPVTSFKRTCPDTDYKPPRPPKPDNYQSGKHDYDSHSSSSSSFDKSNPSFQDKGYDHEHLSSPQKPYCDNKYSCPIANNKKDPNHHQHTEQYFHVCRYGRSCRCLDDPFHKSHFYHSKATPICKYGLDCQNMCNPEHRAKFHHPGYWDWMEVCKYGSHCKKMGDSEHRYNYTHNKETVYPEN